PGRDRDRGRDPADGDAGGGGAVAQAGGAGRAGPGRRARRRRGGTIMTELAILAQADFPAVMPQATLYHYLLVSAAMFVIGVVGFVTRRNLIIMFLCTELMF